MALNKIGVVTGETAGCDHPNWLLVVQLGNCPSGSQQEGMQAVRGAWRAEGRASHALCLAGSPMG